MSMMMPIDEFKQAFNSFKHNKRSCKVKKTFSEVEMCDILKKSNLFPGYTLVFSTGPQIDSMCITGIVQDCNTVGVMSPPHPMWRFPPTL